MTASSTKPRSQSVAIDSVPSRLAALTHSLARFKQQVHQATRGNLEWAYDAILFNVVSHGPMRGSALADLVQTDPSTVSRQVAALVRDKLLERLPDPEDGRASLLQVTDLGLARHARHISERDRHYRDMLAGWTRADRLQFAEYLDRFTTDFEAYKETILAEISNAYMGSPASKEGQE
ncbi:MAG: MarR family winged helix-turn-helix transcriptional regulator [Jatrophihabitans sp.]